MELGERHRANYISCMSKTQTIVAAALLALTIGQAQALDYVAHAGGDLDGRGHYRNSIEALDASYAAGHRTIEVDFLRTTDGDLVCAHDWKRYRTGLDAWWNGNAPMSTEDYTALPDRGCLFGEMVEWFKAHEDVTLFVDMKLRGTTATHQIADALGKDRLVVFATSNAVAEELIGEGFKVIAMSDYFVQAERTPEHMLVPGLYGVGLGPNVDWSRWQDAPVKVYAYTLDDCAAISGLNIDGVYTNTLAPNACE